jgi:hypothetical protein
VHRAGLLSFLPPFLEALTSTAERAELAEPFMTLRVAAISAVIVVIWIPPFNVGTKGAEPLAQGTRSCIIETAEGGTAPEAA